MIAKVEPKTATKNQSDWITMFDPEKPDMDDLVGDEKFKELQADLTCPICMKVAKDPIQCKNDCITCRTCAQKSKQGSSKAKCAKCRGDFEDVDNQKVNRMVLQRYQALNFSCGICKKTYNFSDHKTHTLNCVR